MSMITITLDADDEIRVRYRPDLGADGIGFVSYGAAALMPTTEQLIRLRDQITAALDAAAHTAAGRPA